MVSGEQERRTPKGLAPVGPSLTPSPCSLEAVRLGPSSGLLVDWLEMLDPEVVSNCPDLQRRLLFSRRKVTGQRVF